MVWFRLHNSKGQGMVEYSLALALVALVVILILRGVGDSTKGKLEYVEEQLITASVPGPCWVAAELFGGLYAPKTVAARYYVNHLSPAWFREMYLAHGENWAQFLRLHPSLKPFVRPLFEYFAARGAGALRKLASG